MMSSYEDEIRGGSAPSAARVGADLRAARERLGWTLPAISGHLRIRLAFLEAIEDGRTADLPGNAYAVGFLRTYAQALGLDPDEIARRFRAEAAEANRRPELNFPAPVPERGIPAGALVLIGGLLAIGAYVGWYRMSGERPPAVEMVQPVPDRLAPLADKVAPPLPAPVPFPKPALVVSEPPPPLPSVPPSSAAAAVPQGPYASVPSRQSPAPQDAPPLPVPAPSSVVALANPPPLPPPAVEPVKPDASRIVVRAKSDAWIQVRDRGGQILLNRVLRSGEAWQVPGKPSLLLTTGNAGGTELLVDGTPAASLGNDGAVRRDLPLDADAIKDGRLAVLPARHP